MTSNTHLIEAANAGHLLCQTILLEDAQGSMVEFKRERRRRRHCHWRQSVFGCWNTPVPKWLLLDPLANNTKGRDIPF